MAILIVITTNQRSQQNMHKIYKTVAPELFLGKSASNVFLMKNNGLALKYAWTVKERNPFYVDIYLANELHPHQIPDKVRRAADWKKEQGYGRYPASEETLRKEGIPSPQELEKIELDFLMRSPQKV
ncbi:MAG: hypothetical protein ACOC6R_01345 [Chloroflexota bacterium]